jgi:hypothetical protein
MNRIFLLPPEQWASGCPLLQVFQDYATRIILGWADVAVRKQFSGYPGIFVIHIAVLLFFYFRWADSC